MEKETIEKHKKRNPYRLGGSRPLRFSLQHQCSTKKDARKKKKTENKKNKMAKDKKKTMKRNTTNKEEGVK